VRQEALAASEEQNMSERVPSVVDTSTTVVTTVKQQVARGKTMKRLIVLSDGAYPLNPLHSAEQG
jgi:hypothetical protein